MSRINLKRKMDVINNSSLEDYEWCICAKFCRQCRLHAGYPGWERNCPRDEYIWPFTKEPRRVLTRSKEPVTCVHQYDAITYLWQTSQGKLLSTVCIRQCRLHAGYPGWERNCPRDEYIWPFTKELRRVLTRSKEPGTCFHQYDAITYLWQTGQGKLLSTVCSGEIEATKD